MHDVQIVPVTQMELGGPSHEACAGIVALTGYLRGLAGLAPAVDEVDEEKEVDPALEPAAGSAVRRACNMPDAQMQGRSA